MLVEYTFNTGVRPFDHEPPAGMAFMTGFRDSGNGVYVIPFMCEEVPEGYKLEMACDSADYPMQCDHVVREIAPGSRMMSKYAYFTKTTSNG